VRDLTDIQNNINTKKLKNTIFVGYIERTSIGKTSACVGTLVTVFSGSPCERFGKLGNSSDFERGQTVGARLAGASAIKIVTVLGVSRAAVCKVTLAYTKYGKTTTAKRNMKFNIDRERPSYTEDCSTGDIRTEYSS
jgi:hypothetical protein